jgi:uncharacterized membrane protein
MAGLLSIISAFFYALNMVIARVGLKEMDSFSGGVISMCFSLAGSVVAFAVVMPTHTISARAVIFFALAGISGPCLGRLLLYVGINRLGSAIASSLYAIKPLFSALAAVALLGEKITPGIGIGTLIIIIGLIVIGSADNNSQIMAVWSKKDLIFPVLAGAFYAMAQIFRKLGLIADAELVLGLLIQNVTALFFPLAVAVFQKKKKTGRAWNSRRGWQIFGLAGLCSMVGQFCLLAALNLGKVVIVAPLSTISPLFVLLMVGLFLKGTELINWKINTGALIILSATVLLTLI